MSISASKPLVGVSCDFARVRKQPAQAVLRRYSAAVQRFSDACVVLVPETDRPSDLDTLLGRLDGLLLTGSPSNVQPSLYGDRGESEPSDPTRDQTTLALIEKAGTWGLPVFGICRGLQEVNVAFGGSLTRDLDGSSSTVAHHAPEHTPLEQLFATHHPVSLPKGGLLSTLLDSSEIEVNSVHHQGIDRLGRGLSVQARAPDGLIEAISADDFSIFAVQWHPEWQPERSSDSAKLFGMFGACIRGAFMQEAAEVAGALLPA